MLILIDGIVKQGSQSFDMFLTIILSLSTVTSIVHARCDGIDKDKCFDTVPGGVIRECYEPGWFARLFTGPICETVSGK